MCEELLFDTEAGMWSNEAVMHDRAPDGSKMRPIGPFRVQGGLETAPGHESESEAEATRFRQKKAENRGKLAHRVPALHNYCLHPTVTRKQNTTATSFQVAKQGPKR